MSTTPSKSESNALDQNPKWSSSDHHGRSVVESSPEKSPASDACQRPKKLKVLIGGIPVSQYVSSRTVKPFSQENADKAFSSSTSGPVENASADNKSAIPLVAEDVGGSKDSPKKLKWPKFSFTLTQQEIEEDIFALTGSKPSRKLIKRPKAVQKQLDNLFPGTRLESVTPNDYKVPEASKKKKK